MMVKILYFASIREALKCTEEQIALTSEISSVFKLKACLSQRGKDWSDIFSSNRIIMTAINQKIVIDDSIIHDGDEIAFFPPVTGG